MAEDDEVRITLRLPMELRDHLKRSSDETGRSMNAEIVTRLEESFNPDANDAARLKFFEEMYEQNSEERAQLIEAINNQDRILNRMVDTHRTLTILAKTIGNAFLADGGKDAILDVLASGLRDIDLDFSGDPSEEIPKRSWER